jgi:isopentenyl diphosphate isomerase/L-lactate dehydrogenase-like FMN-dependent dehydrogenase
VLLDSGIRHGSDVVKALALGAKAVLVGRATLYGIAAGGQAGAAKVLKLLATQFEKNMGYVGCRRVSELGPHILAFPKGAP